jgi:hypothetical protein
MTPGRPLRSRSASPVMPSSANRFRHPDTRPGSGEQMLAMLPGIRRMTPTLVMKRIADDRPLPA